MLRIAAERFTASGTQDPFVAAEDATIAANRWCVAYGLNTARLFDLDVGGLDHRPPFCDLGFLPCG